MELKQEQVLRHYKGGMYRIVTLAKNNETDELHDAVVYQDMADPEKVWTQSLKRFTETVTNEGNTVPRFTIISDN